jgi:hypothetical protein
VLLFSWSEMVLVLNGLKGVVEEGSEVECACSGTGTRSIRVATPKPAWKVGGGVPNQLLGSYSYNTVTPTK